MDPNDLFKEFKDLLPSKAKLRKLSLWGATEEERQAASRMLEVMRKAGIVDKEPVPWEDSSWNPANQPTAEEMTNSLIGQQTLAMFRANPPMTAEKDEAAVNAPEPPVTEAQVVANAAMPTLEPDGVNCYMQKLNWPPQPTVTPKPKPEEEPRDSIRPKWVAGTPSPPSRDQTPVSDWNSDANNSPIY
jgi:hypothetical protein